MRIISWNVNGLRAVAQKNFFQAVEDFNADIICLQETKAQTLQVEEALNSLEGYHIHHNEAVKKGYSGVAILSKLKPLSVSVGMGFDEHDAEGRVITAEFDNFYLINVYVPNSSRDLKRLPYRKEWDLVFLRYVKRMEELKPVVICGDFNVAHQPIDIARPKANYNKTAGYTQQEIDGFSAFVRAGLIDAFRFLYPEKVQYSWWSYMFNSREKNIGWRIDYFLISESLKDNLVEAYYRNDIFGSDHCPAGILLNFEEEKL